MDHYTEQLVTRSSTMKDTVLRFLILLSGCVFIAFTVYATLVFGLILLLAIGVAVGYLCWWLYGTTKIEYEYIVTNNDLDIDKIVGKRKRKRLTTLTLNSVNQWGEYTGNETADVNATIIATDATGVNMWYLVADHAKLGKIMLIFSPNEDVIYSMNFGVPFGIKKKIAAPVDKFEASKVIGSGSVEENSDEEPAAIETDEKENSD